MKTILCLLLCLVFASQVGYSQLYTGKKEGTSVKFFSKSPLEDIEAENKTCSPILNTATGDIQIRITMTGFRFDKPLMQEHFNENYVESEKYPYCTFKGKINEKLDWSKEGDNKVTVTGKMDLHGVTKEITIDGIVTKKGNDILVGATFKLKLVDYGIKVPSLYVQNIAEVMDVTLKSTLEPYQKK